MCFFYVLFCSVVYVLLYVCSYVCMCVIMYVCMYVCVSVYVSVYVCMCKCVCMYVCMYVYMCMYADVILGYCGGLQCAVGYLPHHSARPIVQRVPQCFRCQQ